MKSIKPGRGPSMMNAIGSVFVILFGIVWTVLAHAAGAPFIFSLFGIIFICSAIAQAIYHYKNATGKNRYSAFDITENGEEPDPLNEKYGEKPFAKEEDIWEEHDNSFCPYCGAKVEKEYDFCPECGRKLPEDK